MFGPEIDGGTAYRPFGNVSVDGFDLDFETSATNLAPFARRLRKLMDQSEDVDGIHRLLTAAPQCPFPDPFEDQFLSGPDSDGKGSVPMDAVFIQFYNRDCGIQSYSSDASHGNFNFDKWDEWAREISANGNVKLFVGIAASTGAASSGYKSAEDLQPVISYARSFASFGGIMMWDMTQAYANGGYLTAVSSRLKRIHRIANS